MIPGQAPGADSLRAVLDSVFAQPEYRWVEVRHPLAFAYRWWQALSDWLAGVREHHPQWFTVFVWCLIGVVVLIFVHGIWIMAQTIRAASAPPAGPGPETAAVRGPTWYRREALRLARLDRYPEAMQADFLGLVLELDQRHLLRFHPSKTPGEYTAEARLTPSSRDAFRALVRALYGYAFARQPCGPDEFAAWREQTSPGLYAGAN